MLEIKKILVPVDFSEASKQALECATTFATAFRADLVVIHVIRSFTTSASGAHEEPKAAFPEEQSKLETWVPEALRGSEACQFRIRKGTIDDELLAAMKDEQADLIVMGTHGRRAFKRWFLGSVTERILRRVPVPVLTISHLEEDCEARSLSGGRILYATDLSDGAERGMTLAYGIAKRFDSELAMLHVMQPWTGILSTVTEYDYAQLRKELSERLKTLIPQDMQEDPQVSWELTEGTPFQAILRWADEKDVSLIVIDLHGKDRLERALLGSTAERVVRGSHRPVVSIPAIDF